MMQYECGRTQPLFRHDHGKTSGRKPKGLRQILIIIMKHIIHIVTAIINLNQKSQNIWANQIIGAY